MASHVLVAYDGSPHSEDALEYAFEEHADGRITVLMVIDPVAAGYSPSMRLPHAAEEWYERAKADAEDTLAEVEQLADERGIGVNTAVGVGRPSNAIVEYAADEGVDHIVVGSHGRTGVSRILLGSVAEAVMRKSPVPVTVVRWAEDGTNSSGTVDDAEDTTHHSDGTGDRSGEMATGDSPDLAGNDTQ